MKDDNYIVIQGHMINKLGLKGNDLIIYALIAGFTQDGECEFSGSLQYIADWCGSSKNSVIRNLKNLVDKGLITKSEEIVNGIKICKYRCSQNVNSHTQNVNEGGNKMLTGCSQNVNRGGNKMLTNNINNNIEDTININNNRAYRSYVENYTPNDDLRKALMSWVEMRIVDRKAFTHRALELALQKLDKLANNDETKIQIVNESIERGWLSFFEPKKKTWEEEKKDFLAWAEEEDKKLELERDSSDTIED